MENTVVLFIGLMSIWAFLAMGIDKSRALKRANRIPEKTLWILAILGGGIGAYLGMLVFRHKTRKTSFRVGFLLLALLTIALLLYVFDVHLPFIQQL